MDKSNYIAEVKSWIALTLIGWLSRWVIDEASMCEVCMESAASVHDWAGVGYCAECYNYIQKAAADLDPVGLDDEDIPF